MVVHEQKSSVHPGAPSRSGDDYNDFVHTGPGTLAGRYLRGFWQPVYRSRDLVAGHAVPIRIVSEDLTLYRGEGGTVHVVGPVCAHRHTRLSTGWVEEDCIRCVYHGWKYDGSGQCVEQPGEPPAQAARMHVGSYPVQEYLGLIFVYLGEGQQPPIRRFPDFEREGVLENGAPEYWPCNYFNRLDNACDTAHVPWTHRRSLRLTGHLARYDIQSIQTEEMAWGFTTTTTFGSQPPTYVHFHMPNVNETRSASRVEGSLEDAQRFWVDRLFWRVPVDDENSVSFIVDHLPLTGDEAAGYRERRKHAEESQTTNLQDLAESILAGKLRMTDLPELSTYKLFWIEDYVAQVGQGPIADRRHEGPSSSDVGVSLLRKVWRRELKALAEGCPTKQWHTPAGLADMTGNREPA